ncbi:uncharacterized conserved protein YbjT, contains NAD(P)-binding and DUF2867 domains [Bacteroidales bacterium 6E]|nr:uncharacterized conserved protein YbjT, contains NAD(P)-binding and DUF2867 domains [Bacteroidales bacterium 6E]
MKIAVSGSTGQLGRLAVELLKERVGANQVIALARTPNKAAAMGVEVRAFDYGKPEELASGLEGVDRLLLISSSEIGQRAAQHARVIEAALKAGVKRIVYTSLLHADTSTLSLAGEHLATEELIRKSGIPYTILRNGWYTENYTGSIKGAIAAGAFLGSAGEGKISSATRLDFAEAAAVAVVEDSHVGHTYELAGDDSYTLKDLAAEVSRQTGKELPFHNLPEAEYASILEKVGVPSMYAVAIASWDTCASRGDLFDDSGQLSRLIGRPTTPLSEAVRAAL